jgi:2-polyprenyl-3-methyl-5-hydroxy-6-metoxy-1,4-benzoquinol methylase
MTTHSLAANFVSWSRDEIKPIVKRVPGVRQLARPVKKLLRARQDRRDGGLYGASYYGVGRNPLSREGRSGYADYDRWSSHANSQAYLLWRFFPVERTLDVGCARGFVVEALRERGMDANGVDVSHWAVKNASPGAQGHVKVVDLEKRSPSRFRHFDLISAFEVMEHLSPEQVPAVIQRLRKSCDGWLIATVPSIGHNENGYLTCLGGKVRDDRLPYYADLGDSYDGPVPHDDLLRDAQGNPIEGHLTIASYRWWTQQFEAAGFERCAQMEQRLNPIIARFGLAMAWNLYIFKVPGTLVPDENLWPRQFLAAIEHQWGLDALQPDIHSYNAVTRTQGDAGWALVRDELRRSGTPDISINVTGANA